MNIDELTLKDIKQLQSLFAAPSSNFEPIAEVGEKVSIRTVTYHHLGKVSRITKDWLELEDASWVADDGRFHEYLKNGEPNEVEPFVNPVKITLGSIVDLTPWDHDLPREVK